MDSASESHLDETELDKQPPFLQVCFVRAVIFETIDVKVRDHRGAAVTGAM